MSKPATPETKADDAVFAKLHRLVGKRLIERLETPDWKASDLANAIKFLSSNDVKKDPPATDWLSVLSARPPSFDGEPWKPEDDGSNIIGRDEHGMPIFRDEPEAT